MKNGSVSSAAAICCASALIASSLLPDPAPHQYSADAQTPSDEEAQSDASDGRTGGIGQRARVLRGVFVDHERSAVVVGLRRIDCGRVLDLRTLQCPHGGGRGGRGRPIGGGPGAGPWVPGGLRCSRSFGQEAGGQDGGPLV